MTTSTPTAPLGRPGPAAPDDGSVRHVLVGVDGSECGLAAVRWAAREASRRGAPLRIVHAASYLGSRSGGAPPPGLARARHITAQAYTVARHTQAAVPTSTEVVPGDPIGTLLRAAATGQLVVLGSSATGAVDELVLASVAVRVAAGSPQPVVVVPRHHRPGEPVDRPVVAVLGVGDRTDDEAVASFAADAAAREGTGLTLLQTRSQRHSVPASWVDDDDAWASRHPDVLMTRAQLPAARPDQVLRASSPAPLVVISAGGGTLLHRHLDGPHRWLLRHCTSPMALVPASSRRGQERPAEGPSEG